MNTISIAGGQPVQPDVDSELLAELKAVTDEIWDLWWDQQVWRMFEGIAEGSDVARGSFIVSWVGELYYRRADIAVRAMRSNDPKSYSLRNILEAAKARAAAQLTSVPTETIEADLAELEAAAAGIGLYVNKFLAHVDKVKANAERAADSNLSLPRFPIPQPDAVDAAVELLGQLLKKYTLVLTGVDLQLDSVPQFGWTSIFREPWLPTDGKSE